MGLMVSIYGGRGGGGGGRGCEDLSLFFPLLSPTLTPENLLWHNVNYLAHSKLDFKTAFYHKIILGVWNTHDIYNQNQDIFKSIVQTVLPNLVRRIAFKSSRQSVLIKLKDSKPPGHHEVFRDLQKVCYEQPSFQVSMLMFNWVLLGIFKFWQRAWKQYNIQ